MNRMNWVKEFWGSQLLHVHPVHLACRLIINVKPRMQGHEVMKTKQRLFYILFTNLLPQSDSKM